MSLVTGAWIVVAVVGLVLAIMAHEDAATDCELVAAAHRQTMADGERRDRSREFELESKIAGDGVVQARWAAVLEGAFLLAGILQLFQPSHDRTPAQWLVVALLFVGAASTPARLLSQRRRRRQLLELA